MHICLYMYSETCVNQPCPCQGRGRFNDLYGKTPDLDPINSGWVTAQEYEIVQTKSVDGDFKLNCGPCNSALHRL